MHTSREIQRRLWTDPSQIEYHERQLATPYRSTIHLGRFMRSLPLGEGQALDVGCGAGANMLYLSTQLPGFRWIGLDIAGGMLFDLARKRFEACGREAAFVQGDLYQLSRIFPDGFDLVLCTQTLSWLPDWEPALDQLLDVARGWLVLSSLFTDFDVDVQCELIDHTTSKELAPYYVRVFSMRRFRERCEARGCREVIARDFDMDVDLPAPASGGLGTYTRTLRDGRRAQFTGPLFLPWKFVAIRMGE